LNIQPSNLINEACNAINAVGQFKDVLSCVGTGVTVVSCLLSETGLGAAICAGALEDAATTAGLATECLQFIATQLTQRFLGDAAAQILDQIFVLQDPTDPANILSEGCTVLQDLFPPSPGDPGGRVYVADASANVIKVYGSQGNLITVTGTFPGLSTPDGMAYDASNQRIYVANLGNNTVTVYNLDGTLVDLGATAFSGLNDPEDIAFNPINKHFYINEPSTNQVLVFDENGVSVPLAPGAFAGLNSPFGLGWDSANGLIYVANAGNNTMNIYDQLGNPIQTTVGAFPGLNSPDDVSWDPLTGNLYVTGVATDPLGACVINQVFVYTPDGNVVSTTGFTGLNGPDAIVSNGNAVAPLYYVTNICGGTVSVFDKNGGTVTLPTGAFTGLVQPTGVLVIP
jgi:DNA-binding beta-propeller fold protein YncE